MGHLPKILQKLLKFSANLNDGIAIMGDLEEEFLAIKSDRGRVHAWRWFMSLIFSSLHFIIVQFCTGGIGMLINYLKTTFRSLRRHPMFNIINVVGLAIGMACFLLILLFVRHELSYDRHHENADRIYRIVLDARFGGSLYPLCAVAAPTAAALEADYPEVEQAIRIYSADNPIISNKDRYFKENRVTWADEGLFDIFSIALTAGSIESLLAKPNTVAISRTTARKYFGTADPMGSMLLFDGNVEYMVTAVYEDMPTASHFHFDI
ncbi:ABC transporter permease, partial [bacterium]|nr:ABC transporter permease [bacterium]